VRRRAPLIPGSALGLGLVHARSERRHVGCVDRARQVRSGMLVVSVV
jgi:hypothetical protein